MCESAQDGLVYVLTVVLSILVGAGLTSIVALLWAERQSDQQ